MTLGGWLIQAADKLDKAGVSSAKLDAQVLAEHMLKTKRAWLNSHLDEMLTKPQILQLNKLLTKREHRQPVAYLTGIREFYGLEFRVTPAVLIPRPETEYLVEEAIKSAAQNANVLEVGTGSGCICVALKHARPDLRVSASDISVEALEIAKQNASKHNVEINWVLSDMLSGIHNRFDVVLANLPYVPSGTRQTAELAFEPQLALYGGTDGLDYYRTFLRQLDSHLTDVGKAIIEAGPTQHRELNLLAKKSGFALRSATEYISVLSRLQVK